MTAEGVQREMKSGGLSFDAVCDLVGELAALNYFPSDPAARMAIVRLLGQMAASEDQIRTVIREMTDGSLNDWPGPKGLRLRFIARFRPKDGIVIRNCSCGCNGSEHGDYTFKLSPTQAWPIPIAAPPLPLLPPGRRVSADLEIEASVIDAAKRLKRLPAARPTGCRFERELLEIETAPQDRAELPAPAPVSPKLRENLELVTREVVARRERGEDAPRLATAQDVDRFAQELREGTA